MKYLIIMLFMFAGCTEKRRVDEPPGQRTLNSRNSLIYEDLERGIICYQLFNGGHTFSCVKMSDK